MTALLAGLRVLGPKKLAALALVALVSMALVALLAVRGSTVSMSLLYADLDLREAGQVVEQLDRARIPHAIEAGGARILVPAEQVATARMLLAKEGLPSGGSIGYEIFDRADGITASAFQQGISQTRAMEGELARTIRTLQGVRAVRVHLVLPRREPFARDKQAAQASVVLTMAGAARLDREGVQAVLNLIAAAVPGLKPENIAIIDSRGNLLARAGQPSGGLGQTGEDLKHGAELRIAHAVEEMLERSLGAGHVRAEASIDLDFSQVHETQEKFDPEGQVVRSQQSNSGNSRNTEAAQNVSVQNNLPNADPAAGAGGSQDQKSEETTNYEISKTVRTMVREQPQLRRLSLAVMVDGVLTPGPDGKTVWAPRPEEELARIASLVRSAVGFDEKRGDKVDIVSMRFTATEDTPEPAALPVWAQLNKADIIRLSEAGLLAIAVVLCLSFVLRPMVLRLALAGAATSGPGAIGGPAGTGTAGPNGAAVAGPGGAAIAGPGGATIASPGTAALPGTPGATAAGDPNAGPDTMLQLANVEGELRAASIRRVTEMVEAHPEATLTMIRGWVASDNDL